MFLNRVTLLAVIIIIGCTCTSGQVIGQTFKAGIDISMNKRLSQIDNKNYKMDLIDFYINMQKSCKDLINKTIDPSPFISLIENDLQACLQNLSHYGSKEIQYDFKNNVLDKFFITAKSQQKKAQATKKVLFNSKSQRINKVTHLV